MPTLPEWLPPALVGAFFIAVHYAFVRAASGKIGDALGALILESTAALGILAYYLCSNADDVPRTRGGALYSALGGLAISAASILLYAALRKGGPLATTGTVVLGGGVTLSALAAPFLFREPFTVRRAVGIGLGLLAMIVLSQDESRSSPSP